MKWRHIAPGDVIVHRMWGWSRDTTELVTSIRVHGSDDEHVILDVMELEEGNAYKRVQVADAHIERAEFYALDVRYKES